MTNGGGRSPSADPWGHPLPNATEQPGACHPQAMVRPFPPPGNEILSAFNRLEEPPDADPVPLATSAFIHGLGRPWDPATCASAQLREELWDWLEEVAAWINEQHLWSVDQPGIPSCWPHHPHIVHDLAVVACTRRVAGLAVTPDPLDRWHTDQLPAFLRRLADRLADGCPPGAHQARPRRERDEAASGGESVYRRRRQFASDVASASDF